MENRQWWTHSNQKMKERRKRKLEEMSEGESTTPSDDAMFLRREMIDADEKMDKLDEKWRTTR